MKRLTTGQLRLGQASGRGCGARPLRSFALEDGGRFVAVFGAPVGSGAETNSLCVVEEG